MSYVHEGVAFRTTDNAKWGDGKEARLTKVEIDTSLWNLLVRIIAIEDAPVVPTEISSVTLNGSQLTFHMSNGATFGPFTIPIAVMRFRGDWAPATVYYQVELFRVVDQGLFMVVRNHTSLSSFDPNEVNSFGALYSLILPASAASPTDFLSLTDAPASYTGHSGKAVLVNEAADGLVFSDIRFDAIPITADSNFKDNARLATTVNIDLTTGGLIDVDGETVAIDDRILVKDQTSKPENGLYYPSAPVTAGSFVVDDSYTITTVGDTDFTLIGASANTIGIVFTATGVGTGTGTATPPWTRTEDAVDLEDLYGLVIYIEEGTLNGGGLFALTSGESTETTISETITSTSLTIIKNINTAAYAVVRQDLGKWVTQNHGSPNTITFNSMTGNWPVNSEIVIHQAGVGVTTIVAAGLVTITSPRGLVLAQGDTLRLKVKAKNVLIVEAPIAPAGGGAVAWGDVTGKPTEFTPSAHSHAIADTTGLQAALDAKLIAAATTSYTGNRTLSLTDMEKYLRCTDGSASNLTVPPNTDVAIPVDATVHHRTAGAGKVTVVAGIGVTVNPPFGQTLVTPGAGATISLKQVATDVWDLMGLTEAV